MTTATPRKTSFENQHLRSCDYFAIIPSSFNSTMLVKNATTRQKGEPFKQIQRIKKLQLHPIVCRQNRKCGNFTFLFCRGRHEVILKCVPHVQHTYFFYIRPINFLICDVVIPVAVLDVEGWFAQATQTQTQTQTQAQVNISVRNLNANANSSASTTHVSNLNANANANTSTDSINRKFSISLRLHLNFKRVNRENANARECNV